jgi:uncharacterized membrane protein
MVEPAASTEPRLGPILGRSFAIATIVTLLGLGPIMLRDPAGFWSRFARPLHQPDFSPILEASLPIKLHLLAILGAVLVGAVQLGRVKGDRLHRSLGWLWVGAIMMTALSALLIHAPVGLPSIGGVGVLHIFSVIVLVSAPAAVLAARRGNLRRHAGTMSSLYIGGLGVAGLFAFLPGRILWQVFFG